MFSIVSLCFSQQQKKLIIFIPTQSKITFSQEIGILQLYEITDKKVKLFKNANSTFDVSGLENGMYLLKGKTDDGLIINEKVIKE